MHQSYLKGEYYSSRCKILITVIKLTKIKVINLCLFIFLLFILTSPYIFGEIDNYELSFKKGTKNMKVIQYNKTKWDSIINDTFEPSKWISGDSNQKGAISKYTIR